MNSKPKEQPPAPPKSNLTLIRPGTEGGKPHIVEVERAVLGGMIGWPGSVAVAVQLGLAVEDFSLGVHGFIFEAVMQIFNEGQEPGIVETGVVLGNRGRLNAVGGLPALDDMVKGVLSNAMFRQYVKILRDEGVKRRAIRALDTVRQDVARSSDPLAEVLDRSRGAIMTATEMPDGKELRDMAGSAGREMDRAEGMKAGKVQTFALTTGYHGLDRIPLAVEPGKAVILAGRPSVGKTAFALNLMLRFSERQDAGSMFFSLDDGERSAATRMLLIAAGGQIGKESLFDPQSREEIEAGIKAQARLFAVGDNILVDYPSRIRTTGIHAGLLVAKQRNPKIKAFFVDYLSLVSPAVEKKGDNHEREVARAIQEIKAVGKKLDLAAFVLCQLSRDYAKGKKEDAEPQLHHLRESGAIEQDADVVIFLYVPGSDGGEADESTVAVKVAKNKDGRLGHCSLSFRKRYQIFDDPERAGDATTNLKYWNE